MQVLSRVLLLPMLIINPAILLAADLSLKPGEPAMMPPILSWTGFYLGLNAGYGDGRWESDVGLREIPPRCSCGSGAGAFAAGDTTWRSPRLRSSNGTFVGGAQLGYLHQFAGGWVAGAEADLQYAGLELRRAIEVDAGLYDRSILENEVDWFGTARLRAGYAFARLLLYGTGGIAFGQIKSFATSNGNSRSQSETKAGWALGGGLEYALTDNWSVRAEYLYIDFGKTKELVFPETTQVEFYARQNLSIQTIRAGLNYRF